MRIIIFLFAILVTWKASFIVPDPCPDAMRTDPYSGENVFYGCVVYHSHEETKDMSKVFPTMEEAQKFIDEAPIGYEFTVMETK